jgi:hypothetical protein
MSAMRSTSIMSLASLPQNGQVHPDLSGCLYLCTVCICLFPRTSGPHCLPAVCCLSIPYVCLPACCLSVLLSVCPSVCLFVCPSVSSLPCQSVYLAVIYLSACLSTDNAVLEQLRVKLDALLQERVLLYNERQCDGRLLNTASHPE